jgi:excisionase family DNA binding protein
VTRDDAQSGSWLSLGRACQVLGVNESTLRRWADEGRVRTFRTPGGHRRFAEADVRTLLRTSDMTREPLDALGDMALTRIRRRLQGRQITSATWNLEIDNDTRLRMRAFGRRLIGLIDDHLAGRIRRGRLPDEARALGHEYGHELAAGRLPLSSTVEAFTFFRRSLDETVDQLAARHGLSPERAAEARDHIAEVADAVLIAITRAYEDHQAERGRWSL